MSIRQNLKSIAERLPVGVGEAAARVPFSWRFGAAYSSASREAGYLDTASKAELRAWIFSRLRHIVEHAYVTNEFYRTLYQRHSYHPNRLTSLEHFQDVPIVTKRALNEFDVERRSVKQRGRILTNTGGTSGEPLTFYLDNKAFAREWAHMHAIWARAGYSYRDMKLTMRGKNIGKRLIKYNAVHNEWIVNTYADRGAVVSAMIGLIKEKNVRWIHGYPSIVSEVVSFIARNEPKSIEGIRSGLKGVLLGSEFPLRHYTDAIRSVLGVEPTAWYGHSEMCILAFDAGLNHYVPMPTYGLTEAVEDTGGRSRLVGTSYWNTASHFIRYDTGDGVVAEFDQGLVRSFAIAAGREGDFVKDRNGGTIPLTALIFGRHHSAFANVRHLQVRQREEGSIDLLIVPDRHDRTTSELMAGFDFSEVALDVYPILIEAPIRTVGGKIRLLVSADGIAS